MLPIYHIYHHDPVLTVVQYCKAISSHCNLCVNRLTRIKKKKKVLFASNTSDKTMKTAGITLKLVLPFPFIKKEEKLLTCGLDTPIRKPNDCGVRTLCRSYSLQQKVCEMEFLKNKMCQEMC